MQYMSKRVARQCDISFQPCTTRVPVHSEALSVERKRFPTVTAAEATSLVGLFDQVLSKAMGVS